MRRLMSLETRITRASLCSFCSASVWERIALSPPWPGRLSGRALVSWRVWKNSRPEEGFLPWLPRVAARQRQPAVDLLLAGIAHHVVEEAAHLAHVARGFRQALLVGIELLEHHHRQVHVVLFEAEDRRRIVHEHVGVEHEQPPPGAQPALRFPRFARRCLRARLSYSALLQGLPPRDRALSRCATPASGVRRRRAGTYCAPLPGTFCRTDFSA